MARALWLTGLLVAALLGLMPAPAADAGSFSWYGRNGWNCWQTAFPNGDNDQCLYVGAGYLDTPDLASTPEGSGGKEHMIDAPKGAETLMHIARNGEYCGYVKLGPNLPMNRPHSYDQRAYTGFQTPAPHEQYQESNTKTDVCQAYGNRWGHRVRGTSANENCTGNWAPCGMQHYTSMAGEGDDNRPWSDRFGAYPSLNVQLLADPHTSDAAGAWGFACPLLRDVTKRTVPYGIIEFCFETWKSGSGFPALQYDYGVQCNGNYPSKYTYDQVIVRFDPWTGYFATMFPGSQDTNVIPGQFGSSTTFGNPAQRFHHATIGRADLLRAIDRVNTACPNRGLSRNTNDYVLHGIEFGAEGGGLTRLGYNEADLRAYTTTNVLHHNETLWPGWSISSANDRFRAVMQNDGNFVVYDGGHAVWWNNTYGATNSRAVMQQDGNFVVYDAAGWPIWQTGTYSNAKNRLIMQDDGNLVLYAGMTPRWSSWNGRL